MVVEEIDVEAGAEEEGSQACIHDMVRHGARRALGDVWCTVDGVTAHRHRHRHRHGTGSLAPADPAARAALRDTEDRRVVSKGCVEKNEPRRAADS